MGCWNETCYVSKLPIYSGEEVVLILLRKNDVNHEELPHTSYVYEKYVPFGLPIYGKYDDYGNIEEITNAGDVIEYLKDMEIIDNEGDNVDMEIELITPIAIEKGLRFAIREGGRTVGSGVVADIKE